MHLFLLLCSTQVVWGRKWDFYHELSVDTFQPPGTLKEDSLFGFSTTHDRYNKRLMISAPRENNLGVVYECDLSKIDYRSCRPVTAYIVREAEDYTHDYWFGATLKSNDTDVVACTPRYTRHPKDCKNAGTYGRCFRRTREGSAFMGPLFPRPIALNNCTDLEKGMDSLGWSLDIGEDSSIIMGSPAMFQNTGTAAVLGVGKSLVKRIDKIESNIYNFGYAVAVGRFIVANRDTYAVSTTYGHFGEGQVYFYNQNGNGDFGKALLLSKGVDETVVGTMYGAVLCVANINDRGQGDDLLVGAPTYHATNAGYDTGAVYVYGYKRRGSPPQFRRKLVGHTHGSMFGSAIVSVGDLNGDKKDEIAIGAPFEDDGAVYLYSGAAVYSEKSLTWLQKIKPGVKNLASFGHSLAVLKDYDNNGCNELAVSAPYKNRVMLYKCLAAITVTKIYAIFPNVKNRIASRQTDFVFQVCIDVKYPEKPIEIIAEISTDVKMHHMYATLKNLNSRNVYNYKTSLNKLETTYCKNVDFVLPLDKDYGTVIGYEITTSLNKNPMDMSSVTGAHVVLSDNSKLYNSGSFWAGECSGASECISNLTVNISTGIEESPLITGSRDNGMFSVQVLNTGEVAYDPCLQLSIVGGTLQKSPMYCSYDDTHEETWLCKTMKPVRTNGTWDINDIVVDFRGLTNQDKQVTLKIKLFERCAETNNSKSYEYSIPLRSNSDGINIKGITDVGKVSIVESELLFSKHFEQIYTIINRGPTNFKDLVSNITILKTDYVVYGENPVSIHIDGTSQSKGIHKACKTDTNDVRITAICDINSLFKDNFVKIKVSMDTNPKVLTYDVLKQGSVSANSTLTVYFDSDEPKSYNLSSLIKLSEAFVDLWILIAAGLVGLLLIIVIAVILYKNGFLKRKNKEELTKLKQEVYRQSVRRSMMTRPATSDRSHILDNMEITEEPEHIEQNPEPMNCDPEPPVKK